MLYYGYLFNRRGYSHLAVFLYTTPFVYVYHKLSQMNRYIELITILVDGFGAYLSDFFSGFARRFRKNPFVRVCEKNEREQQW